MEKYKTEDLERLSLEAIEKFKLFFVEDIIPYLPCSRSLFYDRSLDKLDTIKDALTKNKVQLKVSMRSKWYKSDNATLQMALMKLICSEDERKRLSVSYTENVNKTVEMTEQEIREQIEAIDKLLHNGNRPVTKETVFTKATAKRKGKE
ncbi:MAG: hypothetical protein E6Q36_01190 [Chryseobacterium sp.]|nr:MAG: hypothetical protein E6Q36_01190 [Chryseobacterium sp.]